MKYIFASFFSFVSLLSALHVDHPGSTTILSREYFDPEQSALSLRGGVELDYIRDARLRHEDFLLSSGTNFIYDAKGIVNWGELMDFTFRLGKNEWVLEFLNTQNAKEDVEGPPGISFLPKDSKNCITSKKDVLYSLGARVLLWRNEDTQCSLGYRLDRSNLSLDSWMLGDQDIVNGDDSIILNGKDLLLKFKCTQVDLGISYDAGAISPYVGGKYSDINLSIEDVAVKDREELGKVEFFNRAKVGLFIGLAVCFGDISDLDPRNTENTSSIHSQEVFAKLDMVVRFFDESGLSMALEFKF